MEAAEEFIHLDETFMTRLRTAIPMRPIAKQAQELILRREEGDRPCIGRARVRDLDLDRVRFELRRFLPDAGPQRRRYSIGAGYWEGPVAGRGIPVEIGVCRLYASGLLLHFETSRAVDPHVAMFLDRPIRLCNREANVFLVRSEEPN